MQHLKEAFRLGRRHTEASDSKEGQGKIQDIAFVFEDPRIWGQQTALETLCMLVDVAKEEGMKHVVINLPTPLETVPLRFAQNLVTGFSLYIEQEGLAHEYIGYEALAAQTDGKATTGEPMVVLKVDHEGQHEGRSELVRSIRKIREEGIPVNEIDEEVIANHLDIPELSDFDGIIFIGEGEPNAFRLVGRFTWQSAYAEMVRVANPTREAVEGELEEIKKRPRSFGGRPPR